MAITVYKQKNIDKNLKKKKKWDFFLKKLGFFSEKSWYGEEFTKLRPETESRNSGDHEFWNHEMRGSPVAVIWADLSENWSKMFTSVLEINVEYYNPQTVIQWLQYF